VSLVHGWVSDPAGNVLFSPPLSENLWGALGARHGAIVSVEKIVDTDFIRAHGHLARLPASYVQAVVELPFGAHPSGFFGRPVRGCQSYAEDYDFIVDFRNANRDADRFREWVEKWVLSCATHEEYLKKVGPSRLADLIAKGRPDAWELELAGLAGQISRAPQAAPSERMTVEAARRLVSRCRTQGYRTILAGQGVSNLAAWLACYLLRRESVEIDLVAETGLFGYDPRPGNPFLFNFANLPRCKMLCDALWTLGAFVGGSNSRCLGSLSAGQVDRNGNVNSTLIPGAMYLVGSGGACDVLNTAAEVMVSAPLAPFRFVDRVPYVTGPGTRVTTLVTDRAVWEKAPGGGELKLSALFRDGDRSREELVRSLRGEVGWSFAAEQDPSWIEPATLEELLAIRLMDPRRAFLKLPKES
jgi:hypothetical protein